VTQDSFELACDRLSQAVDGTLFERLRWARTEGPMLARLVVLVHSAIERRSDLALTEEGSTGEVKRFILKVHNNRIVAISIGLDEGQAVLRASTIERSPYRLADLTLLKGDYHAVDEHWMACALQEIFDRIQS
jgi:hypothetical protein